MKVFIEEPYCNNIYLFAHAIRKSSNTCVEKRQWITHDDMMKINLAWPRNRNTALALLILSWRFIAPF